MSEQELTPQQINRLKVLAARAIEMQADIRTVVTVFKGAMKAFGMSDIKMSEGASIQSVMPDIVRKLTLEFGSGTFDTQALANIQAAMPIIEKYNFLTDEQ